MRGLASWPYTDTAQARNDLRDLPQPVRFRMVAEFEDIIPATVEMGSHRRVNYNLDGQPWRLSPLPFRLHRCAPQTCRVLDDGEGIAWRTDYCRCGASRSVIDAAGVIRPRRWVGKNSRPRGLRYL